MNKKLRKHAKKIMLSLIGAMLVCVAVLIVIICQKFNTQATTLNNLQAGCIKNKDQAMNILLGTGLDLDADTATMIYKKEIEARGNQVFFEEYPDSTYATTPDLYYLNVGEELKNGGKLLHAQYSYRIDKCDIDLDDQDISLKSSNWFGDDKRYQFSYINNDGAKDQFIDETKRCSYQDPTTQLADLDGDGQKEIIADCFHGGTSINVSLYVYKLKDNKLTESGALSTRLNYEIKDCNGDSILDIATHFRANDVRDCDKEKCLEDSRILTVYFCNHWDNQKNEFVETETGEE